MTVDEFLAHFPEVPPDLRDEPVLGEYVRAFGLLLRVAQKPTLCMRDTGDHQHSAGNAPNRLRLISPHRFAGRILRPRACPTPLGTLAARRFSYARERASRHMSTAAGAPGPGGR